ncbi:MAG TPA: protein kinase, partial [Nannocystis sp.]
MAQGVGGGSDGLTLQLRQQLAAARAVAPDLEVQQLKASVRARLFGIVDTPPMLGGYTIVRLIGRGGMGAVYEAHDERGEVVALKTLRGCEPAALVRFKHEFRALSDLVHPNLALLYSLAVTGDQAFLTMERIDGVDFLTYVGQAPAGELAPRLHGALAQLIDGLGALHAAGKLHRDVKPSNVLVTREGRVVILDFGLVQELAGATIPGGEALAGTPAYMAPELFLGAMPTTASDWYSVGVMLYEALAGTLPFTGTALAVLRDKCERDPPPPPDRGGEGADTEALARLCMQLLERDPAARPDRKAILRALEAAAPGKGLAPGTGEPGRAARLRSPAQAPLIGRQDELDVLRKAAAGVRSGEPAVVLVRGGSGLGKTTLVDSFLQELRGQAVILRGRCYEREQVPHNAFDGLVDALVGHLLTLDLTVQSELLTGDVEALVRLFPGLQRLPWPASDPRDAEDPAEVAATPDSRWRHRAYTAFKALLGAIAARTPVVLYIDDLHWADADSATLLAALFGAPAPSCLLLTSYRAGTSGPAPVVRGLLQQLRAGGVRVWELTLEPLTLDEAEQLARALLGPGPAAASARMVARESAGIPLFVHELVHDVLGCISAGAGAFPARLEDLIGARVRQLPGPARDMLEMLAVAARPLARDLVIALSGQTATGRAALQTLGTAGLVRASRSERGEQIEVCHDRTRETVLAGLDEARVRDCHRRLAATIEAHSLVPGETPIEPEILAHHLYAAGDPAGARQHMITAASRAAKALAFARAAELSLAATRLCPPDDVAGRLALRIDAAQALMHAGQLSDAAACFLEAAGEAPPVQALRLRQRAAEVLLNCGAPRRGMALLQEV